MQIATGELTEIIMQDDGLSGRITCPSGLVPTPGQYLLASRIGSDDPLAAAIFKAADVTDGFIAAILPDNWLPGAHLHLRGPLGRGFTLPKNCTRLVLASLGETPRRLLALLPQALAHHAAVVLVSDRLPSELPSEVEVQRLAALPETVRWGDFLALDLSPEELPVFRQRLGLAEEEPYPPGQALIHTPMPCGALAECGVCAVAVKRGWELACKDGPVFDLSVLG